MSFTTQEINHNLENKGIIFWALKLWSKITSNAFLSICIGVGIVALILIAMFCSGCILWDTRKFTYAKPESFYITEVSRIHLRIREFEKSIKYGKVIGGLQANVSQNVSSRKLQDNSSNRTIIELADISVDD